MADSPGEVTRLLARLRSGQHEAEAPLMDMLYKELRQIAAYHMQKERADHTLQPTALVHEAYKRLIGVTQTEWQSRAHFLAIASQVMRRVLIDYAKQHRSEKRGSGQTPLPLDGLLELGKSSEKSFRLSSTNYDDCAFPEMAKRRRHTGVDRWMPYLEQRWAEDCHNAAQLWREIQQQGFRGCPTTIRQWMARLRGPSPSVHSTTGSLRRQVPPSPRQTTWLLLHPDRKRSADLQAYAEALLRRSLSLARVVELTQQFLELCRRRSGTSLDAWLKAAKQTSLRAFAHGVERDRSALEATLCLPWSNGPVEGQIHRLKLIKRQGYGRANFDLLKQRVLHAA